MSSTELAAYRATEAQTVQLPYLALAGLVLLVADRRREHIAELNWRAAETELRLKQLYDAIESGVADLNDPPPKNRIDGLKATRNQARADAERVSALLLSAASRRSRPRCCTNSPRPRGGESALREPAIAAIICVCSLSGWKWIARKFASWA